MICKEKETVLSDMRLKLHKAFNDMNGTTNDGITNASGGRQGARITVRWF
jgi:hypothetical protein